MLRYFCAVDTYKSDEIIIYSSLKDKYKGFSPEISLLKNNFSTQKSLIYLNSFYVLKFKL